MNEYAIQLRQRGTLTLPVKLRNRYNLETGDTLTLIELDGLFLLAPKLSVVSKLAAEIEQLREEAGLSIDDLLEGLDEQRRRYYQERYGGGT
jgi:bifunctional DNA-binding transcriptional regulator/antitoxin component of YhaV-PrlF toxin-antitoxin module